MAKVLFNPVMEQIRGKIGDLVFRRTSGGMAVMRRTEPAETGPSAAQQQARERFRLAAAYAAEVKGLASAAAEARKGEITNVTKAFQYLAKFDVAPKNFAPIGVLEGVAKAQGWDLPAKKKK